MNSTLSTLRIVLIAAGAAFVTSGCAGGGGGTDSSQAGAGAGTGGNGGGSASGGTGAPHSAHHRCGWLGADTFDAGKRSFLANPDYYDAIHPKWATLTSNGGIRMLSLADDGDIMSTAKQHQIKVIPLIDTEDVSYLRIILSSPANITAHAAALTDMVVKHGYDGVELDYEHLWTAADRAPYIALISAVSQSLHAQGKLLTLALPAMDVDHKDSAYDYTQLQSLADVLHLMGYDFHYMGGDHLGPLAPKGWINDVVTHVQSLGAPQKYILGVANYGIAGSWYASARQAAARCNGGTYSSATDHMAVCPLGHQEAGLAPHCSTSQGDVWFEDVASMTEKAALARAHGLGGVGYWTMGDEPDGFFSAMQAQFGN